MGKVKSQLEIEELVSCCQCNSRSYSSMMSRFFNSHLNMYDYICDNCLEDYGKYYLDKFGEWSEYEDTRED